MELGRDCLPMLISDHKRHRLQYNNVMYLRIGPQAPLVASNREQDRNSARRIFMKK